VIEAVQQVRGILDAAGLNSTPPGRRGLARSAVSRTTARDRQRHADNDSA
jgi:hypothetical protein